MRFFFDIIRDGIVSPDQDGIELPDTKAAQREAVLTMSEVIKDFASRGSPQSVTMLVRDVEGHTVVECTTTISAFHWIS